MGLQFEWDEKKQISIDESNWTRTKILWGVLIMNLKDEMLEEYDFSNGICGKYAQAYKEGVNIIKLDRDVMRFFPDAKSVNEALKTLINLMNNGQSTLWHKKKF